MVKEKYHHGDLRQTLIDNGLLLLNKDGVEGFSLRKVASMCDVSHTAPYKHFKDKDELIGEIIKEVWKKFYLALFEVTKLYPDNPKVQVIEMGKAYVKFMIEYPEYLKFMFLSDNAFPVKIKDNKFINEGVSAFSIFKDSAESFLRHINLDESLYTEKILTMWSLVHGIAVLITKKSIEYNGDYLELVEQMIKNNLVILINA